MKKILSMMCLAGGIMMFPACSNDSEVAELDANQPKSVEVSLNMGGDAITISDSPITRDATKKKFYAINVYYKSPTEKEGEFTWTKYAYGLFDNLASMKISLMTDEKYKFECVSIQEDKDELYSRLVDGISVYFEPFTAFEAVNAANAKYLTKVKNKFILNSYNNLEEIDMQALMDKRKKDTDKKGALGVITYVKKAEGIKVPKELKDNGTYIETYYPGVDRMYGAVEDYTPKESGTVTIPMKRTGFRMVFNIVPPAESTGVLRVSCDSIFGDIDIPHGNGKTVSFASFYSFKNQDECITAANEGKEYSVKRTVTVVWADNTGDNRSFGKTFDVKRNVTTTINIDPNSFDNASVYIGNDVDPSQEVVNIGGKSTDVDVNP